MKCKDCKAMYENEDGYNACFILSEDGGYIRLCEPDDDCHIDYWKEERDKVNL
jgi:hypothetical protein